MVIIKRFPQMFKSFFEQISTILKETPENYHHLWRLVLTLASLEGRFSLSEAVAKNNYWRTRQSVVHFLENQKWNEKELLARTAITTLRRLGWRTGEPLILVVDDTQIQKRGKKMEGVSKLFLHSEKRFSNGHAIVAASIVYKGVSIPFALRMWVNRETCENLNQKGNSVLFRKMTELASDCIQSFDIKSSKVTVVFDRYYLCQTVISTCEEKGFYYAAAVKSNRYIKSTVYSQRKYKVGSYAREYLNRNGSNFKILGTSRKYRIAEKVCYLAKVGRVKVVFSRRLGDREIITLATNDVDCSAKEIVEVYRNRWTIEVLFKSAKQQLGLGDYQFLKLRAVERYLHLVMLSHIFLTHLAYKESNEKESKKAKNLILSAGVKETKLLLRNILLLDAFDRIKISGCEPTISDIVKIIKRKALALFCENRKLENARKNIFC